MKEESWQGNKRGVKDSPYNKHKEMYFVTQMTGDLHLITLHNSRLTQNLRNNYTARLQATAVTHTPGGRRNTLNAAHAEQTANFTALQGVE